MSFYLSSFFYFFEKQLSFAYTELWIIKKGARFQAPFCKH